MSLSSPAFSSSSMVTVEMDRMALVITLFHASVATANSHTLPLDRLYRNNAMEPRRHALPCVPRGLKAFPLTKGSLVLQICSLLSELTPMWEYGSHGR